MKSNKKNFLVIFAVVATELIGFGLIIPILPQLASKFQTSGFLLGFLMASYSLAQFIAAPILGKLSDHYGRKPILVISKFGTVISYIILAYANNYTFFLISRLLDGFTGGNIAVARAYISDITTKEDRSKGMAIIGISFGVGFILGPALGGLLFREGSGHFIPALVAGSLSLIALVLTLVLIKEPKKHSHLKSDPEKLKSIPHVLKNPAILVIFCINITYMLIFSGFETTFSIFTNRMFSYTEQQNSFLFFYIGILALFIQGYLSLKSTPHIKNITFFGLFVFSISITCLGLITTVPLLLINLAVLSIGICIVNTYLPSLLTINYSQNTGTIMGIYEGLSSLSRILGPLIVYTAFFTKLPQLYSVSGILLGSITLLIMMVSIQKKSIQING